MKYRTNTLLRLAAETLLADVINLRQVALFVSALCLPFSLSLFAASSVLMVEENFEGTMACKLSSVGSFPVAPGIKSGAGVGGSSAYGFGRSTCRYDAWDGYVNDLTFTFPHKCVITKVKFWEIERYDNWGSQGWLIANGAKIDDTTFGRLPSNDRIADSSFREKEFDLNVVSSSLTFRCWDITDCSELFIDNIRIYGYIYEETYTVSFNANGGFGDAIPIQGFGVGKSQKLYKNVYNKDGYVFQGWASNSVDRANAGIVDYKDEAETTVDSDMTLYAVWANPALTLTTESADWSSGSITLRCEDSDTSGSEHKYTLEYKNASGVWEEVDGAKNVVATKGQDANGQEVWVAKLTDEAFWSRLGGLPPVEYRVKDENGRVSTGCVTRNRHGLYVGVGEYEDGEKRGLPSLPFAPSDASKFKGIAEKHAKFSGRPVYANHDATIEAVDAALGDLVDCSQSGDICLFYITTHGGYDGKDGLICLYDGDYTHSALTEKVSRMADKGIAFIAVVGTCHAEAMLQMDFPNAAVVAAATMETSSTATFDEIFMYDGWEDCCAAPGPTMTFENLADYAIEKYNSLFGGIDFLDEDAEECYPYRMSATKNDVGGLLGKIVARTDCTSDFDIATKPSVVSGFSATTNDSEKISVSWNAVQGAERYYLFYGRLGNPQFIGYKVIEIDDGTSCAFGIDKDWVKETSKAAPARFMVKAYNVAGASPVATANGWRYREFSIIFYTIDHERVDWDEPSFNRYKDDEVVKCVEYGDEYILKCLPKAKKPGYYLKGWYDLNDNEAVAGLTLNSDAMYHAEWREIAMPQIWLDEHVDIVEHSGGDLATAAAMTAANGTRTVDECYRLGIDPEDPEDDLKIAEFKMKDGKPEITLNHTKDGSGNSFEDRVKILGKAELTDAEWQEVPPEGNPAHRFFKVGVEMP